MPRKDRILRSYLSMYTNRNRQKANSDVKYSVNFEYLMTGEGITGNVREIYLSEVVQIIEFRIS